MRLNVVLRLVLLSQDVCIAIPFVLPSSARVRCSINALRMRFLVPNRTLWRSGPLYSSAAGRDSHFLPLLLMHLGLQFAHLVSFRISWNT